MAMQPLSALKPPPVNEDTERVFRAVNNTFNDIDRRLYPPVETLRERKDELVRSYEAVGREFAADAAVCGLSGWLRYCVLSRVFTTIYGEWPTSKARTLFEEIERIGYPHISPMMSLRVIWANVLAEAGHANEAQAVARLLKQDVQEYARLHPGYICDDDVSMVDSLIDRFDVQ